MNVVHKAWNLRWSWVFSIALGVFIAPVISNWSDNLLNHYHEAYDQGNPVVVMSGTLVKQDAESAYVHMAGTKQVNRSSECTYVRVKAYTRNAAGVMKDAYIQRVDMPEDGHNKPPGNFDIGVWRIWPKDDASSVVVYAIHSCNGRQVRTVIADVVI